MTVKETLAQLVHIDSVSSRSNANIADCLTTRCAAIGLSVRRLPCIDERGIEKINLIALAGADFSDAPEVELALVGYTDTVPYHALWLVATTLTERDGILDARGACE